MARLSLSLLGPVQVSLDGGPVTGFEYDKVRALLIYLAVEAACAHPRAALAGLLWPALPEQTARRNLSQGITTLRQAIADQTADPPFLHVTRDTVQFNLASDHWLDVSAFTTLLVACATHPHRHRDSCRSCAHRHAQAAALYRGDFLAHFFLPDSAAFEEWAALKRERWHQQALGALAQLAAHYVRRGAYDEAQRYTRREVELDPWNEEAHRQLMHALWLGGQRSAALAQYERCRRTLKQELGVEPAVETTAMYERIRAPEGEAPGAREPCPEPDRGHYILPAPTTSFVGRATELAHLGDLLQHPDCRLITLLGPGGIGKTRLALQTVTDQHTTFADRVAFVPLAPLASVDQLVLAIATSLNLVLDGRADPKGQLLSYLREKEMLLVLDSFEHLLEGAGLLGELLQRAPRVTLLVTSRERLRLQGEWVVDVPGLPYPDNVQNTEVEGYSAVQLFVQRARQARAGFALTADETHWVVRICRQVAGMPLGLELAAVWVRTLSCQEIAQEIQRSLDFLSGSLRDLPERHRSLRAVLNHSWRLLGPEEHATLRRLAVFRSGFQREAAEQVTGGSLAILAALVDRSLLHRTAGGRYDLHEFVRQYAAEQLRVAGEVEALHRQHAHYYLTLAEVAEPAVGGPEQGAWLDRLERELDNLRAALQWALDREEPELGLRLSAALRDFWPIRGHLREGYRWLEATLAQSDQAQAVRPGSPVPPAVRAKALYAAGNLGMWLSHETMRARLEESLVLYRELGDTWGIAATLHLLGNLAWSQGDHMRVNVCYEESLALSRERGDTMLTARVLRNYGWMAHAAGDSAAARPRLEEALMLFRQHGDKSGAAVALQNLGDIARDQGDYARASMLFQEGLALGREVGDKAIIAWSLNCWGEAALMQGDYAGALVRYQESLLHFREAGNTFGTACVLHNQGYVAQHLGDVERMVDCFVESLQLWRDLGDQGGIADCLAGLAGVAAMQAQARAGHGRLERARRGAQLFGAADALHEAVHARLLPAQRIEIGRNIAAVRTQFDEAIFAEAWAEGRAMSLEQAIAYALEEMS